MAVKLTSQQQAQLAFLQTLPPKLHRVHTVIEQMAAYQADESVVRGLCRMLDEMKAGASQLRLGPLADTAGLMSSIARRSGGLQVKVRGLRELWASLKLNYEGGLRIASTPGLAEEPGQDEP
jgi:hypothetical protein